MMIIMEKWRSAKLGLLLPNFKETPGAKGLPPECELEIWYGLREILYHFPARNCFTKKFSVKYLQGFPLILWQMTKSILPTCFPKLLINICHQCPKRQFFNSWILKNEHFLYISLTWSLFYMFCGSWQLINWGWNF